MYLCCGLFPCLWLNHCVIRAPPLRATSPRARYDCKWFPASVESSIIPTAIRKSQHYLSSIQHLSYVLFIAAALKQCLAGVLAQRAVPKDLSTLLANNLIALLDRDRTSSCYWIVKMAAVTARRWTVEKLLLLSIVICTLTRNASGKRERLYTTKPPIMGLGLV